MVALRESVQLSRGYSSFLSMSKVGFQNIDESFYIIQHNLICGM
jgi:hypothetical protein